VERALVALGGELHVLRAIQGQFKVNSRSFQGQFRVPAGWVQGGTPGPLLEIDTDLTRGHDRPRDCVPASRSARPRWRPTSRLRWLQGPATNCRSPTQRFRQRVGIPTLGLHLAVRHAVHGCDVRVGDNHLSRRPRRGRDERGGPRSTPPGGISVFPGVVLMITSIRGQPRGRRAPRRARPDPARRVRASAS